MTRQQQTAATNEKNFQFRPLTFFALQRHILRVHTGTTCYDDAVKGK